ncbi:hypothetical protein QAD02_017323 [Eretmocerus hayati]|uniref:Uncharacterized protein n=1 Tax=Eretmocerus hayati TaxID=131215 RepID=A0ACC2PDJ4_9HYME|nr:hypothetical protein QAD02_017323 [Eretmocerus hayati]
MENISDGQVMKRWNVLVAIGAVAAAWKSVTPETIANWLRKARTPSTQELCLDVQIDESTNEDWEYLKSHQLSDCETFEDFISIDNNLAVCEPSNIIETRLETFQSQVMRMVTMILERYRFPLILM